ncbi:glucosamine-6-phosphate deaminase [Paenibacillus abyssi]|uniref:Glucosamine-6-phosphate deaminase n=1 Tax=Paenibacillus abyssi TaxID=1340531 RepID=A0A917D289_9BACL|nr:glucosamine-6-phosphate deaminase [Paenibacillus abyssi]GGG07427.1 glucosamine-6-phosphate deaminase [Paenibacillus abyssi]
MNEANSLIVDKTVDQLRVLVFKDRQTLGKTAGEAAASQIKKLLQVKPSIRMIFAAAPSQNEFLDTLANSEGIDWSRVTAFHMDEYIGLPLNAPQSFGKFLTDRLFSRVEPGEVHLIDGTAPIETECERYSRLITEAPIDIVCLGIGENGHLAFNDPPVADFNDTAVVKPVELEHACRQQQVNDKCFDRLEEVPTHALTLTIPALTAGAHLYCMVPGTTKREAVLQTLNDAISTACPSTILRLHPSCTLYTDTDSYGDAVI